MGQKKSFQIKPWNQSADEVIVQQRSSIEGLSNTEAQSRLAEYGPNQIVRKKTLPPALRILLGQFKNWLTLILLGATVIAFFLGEHVDAIIIVCILSLSVLLGFFQEFKAEKTVEKLKKFVSHHVKVKRDGSYIEIDSKEVVIGDVVKLTIGDLVPADIRLLMVDELTTDESVLTGESVPVEKQPKEINEHTNQPSKLSNMVFMGSTVSGGYGEGVVIATGNATFFGTTVVYLEKTAPESDFQKETKKFSVFLFRIIAVMIVFVFLVNAWQGKGLFESFFFTVALAVSITPELLPAIMTITLSQGALMMAKKKVIVKKLMSVEDFGNIDTLCTDKTGTLTQGTFTLTDYVDPQGQKDSTVLLKALLCTADFAHGKNMVTTNPTDHALWTSPDAQSHREKLHTYTFIDENEFDYERRRMSVLTKHNGAGMLLVVKGSPESVLPLTTLTRAQHTSIQQLINAYEEDGYRVIVIAEKKFFQPTSSKKDEKNLQLVGLILFSDPVKPDVKKSIELFQRLGVTIKILSGDSVVVTKSVAEQVGLTIAKKDIISGELLEGIPDSKLEQYACNYNFFARITPEQKYKIVAALNQEGHVVGFLGDGVNDAPALKAADVGIAVNTGASVAKEAADIILLRKDLHVLAKGIEAGRKTFGNIMKYILNTISGNFGNMFTVAISSLFLSFIPLLPKQILLTNFLSDIPLFTLATDNVDSEFTKKPKRWNIQVIGKFMLYFGLLSTFFDLVLILPMVFAWKVAPEVFRTSWFIESSLSEMLITFVIRTKLPFYRSTPSILLMVFSILCAAIAVSIPTFTFGQKLFEFAHLPAFMWLWIIVVLISYLSVAEIAKRLFFETHEL